MELPKLKAGHNYFWKSRIFWFFILTVFLSSGFGFLAGGLAGTYLLPEVRELFSKLNMKTPQPQTEIIKQYIPQTSQEQATIKAIQDTSPAVVSIVITKDVPIIEQYFTDPFQQFFGSDLPQLQIPQYRQNGTQKQEVGGGTGFLISEDGMILTNKHVVSDTQAEYTVLTNDGKKYPATVLARDPVQDLAIIKIEPDKTVGADGQVSTNSFPIVTLGDSDSIQIGQSIIAIGNALAEFRNTVSVGVISGLGRTITAGEGGTAMETLEDVIQTDAAINQGNSGGPLLNLRGEVIGINTATVQGAQSIGFAIPINKAKRDIDQVEKTNKIVYPFLGVRYILINASVEKDKSLTVDYGALIIKGSSGEPAVSPNSGAAKAGLKENDIILELNGEKITTDNPLAQIILKYNPGDTVTLKVLRGTEEKTFEVTLTERSE